MNMSKKTTIFVFLLPFVVVSFAADHGDKHYRHQRTDSFDFDPMSFLVDPDVPDAGANSPVSTVPPTPQASSLARSDLVSSIPQASRIDIPVVRRMEGETEQQYQKRRNKRRKLIHNAKPEHEKEMYRKKRNEEQRMNRKRIKEQTGFSELKQARLAEFKQLESEGRATDEQKEEIRKAYLQRKATNLKYESKKVAQGFKRKTKGWVKLQPDKKS
ncbi:uncharacterized protein FA14DRAFT_181919 [Meira miltonrushii]|uniref:Uncharacterized protein n=1 Tax=Meira miltonrushii TaxID=1280837 RepID=A0A316V397_9BASI|nr:uncharacterized protein FA14DRAFT_181919 [Meira miltonrushii]PWN32000.1 hypothetical protein FA14DRAFT_181919 [Meira miltonrushii]